MGLTVIRPSWIPLARKCLSEIMAWNMSVCVYVLVCFVAEINFTDLKLKCGFGCNFLSRSLSWSPFCDYPRFTLEI